ncbi:MAG: FAD-dependent oxidoreductase, partial [Thermacetogeniaceae bacterium]
MDFDVIVIGGGPIGCAVARDIAAAGCRVLVVEEHPRIGDPLRCSGLITSRTLQLSRVSTNVVLHKLTGARVHAPGGDVLELHGNRVYALAVDRAAFDRDLAAQAKAAGAEVMCSMRAEDINLVPGGVQVKLRQRGTRGKIEKISSFLVIGADGYRS